MTESRFNQLVALTTLLSLAGALVLVARFLLFPPDIARLPADVAPPRAAAAPQPPPQMAALTRAILDNDIFGLRPTAEATKAAPPAPTKIDVDLTGTVVTGDPDRNVAFLRDKSARIQKPFAVGDNIRDARISRIGKNFVILTRQGREEILSMKP